MPYRSGDEWCSPYGAMGEPSNSQYDALHTKYTELKAEHDKVTALLCQVCYFIDDWDDTTYYKKTLGLFEWWHLHKELDAQRRSEEERKKELTRKELRDKIAKLQKELEGV